MQGDIKEVVGVLMRCVGGGETTHEEVEELMFDADGALGMAVNGGFLALMEFAFDRDERMRDPAKDAAMRADLQHALDEIVRLAEAQ